MQPWAVLTLISVRAHSNKHERIHKLVDCADEKNVEFVIQEHVSITSDLSLQVSPDGKITLWSRFYVYSAAANPEEEIELYTVSASIIPRSVSVTSASPIAGSRFSSEELTVDGRYKIAVAATESFNLGDVGDASLLLRRDGARGCGAFKNQRRQPPGYLQRESAPFKQLRASNLAIMKRRIQITKN
ncbi:hypothetical protein QR680_008759 [Steinernema hermaphroditum]|uniref:Uncharacterized protein n=1 Tax=Steinernema hermaphroditum TaxID=289476 RepID=A0AA39IHV7_9BILA|nr:hypothetical protein QR680_008759 [Steinernema hermaphroditum]